MKKTYKQNLDNMKLSGAHKYSEPTCFVKPLRIKRMGKMCRYLMMAHGHFDVANNIKFNMARRK